MMNDRISNRKIVVVNQAVNYLTIGMCNAFAERFETVELITGSVHVQGEELNPRINVTMINKWVERPATRKMWSYLRACFRIFWLLQVRFRKHEVFFVSIPPMAYLINLLTFQRFSMLIWDVYPDIFRITGMKESHPVYRTWALLNRWSFRKAFRLYTIGDKMADLLAHYTDRSKILITPIWSIFQENEKVPKADNPFVKAHGLQDKFVVQYSGNIGLSHRVEHMVALAEKLLNNDRILFQIIGRGPRMPYLQRLVEEKNLENCRFLPFQSDEMFPYSLSAADVGVVILDEANAKGSVPSKTYNLMSYGIPTIYIAPESSELYIYAQKYENGKCFGSDDLDRAAVFLSELVDDHQRYEKLARNSVIAATNFRRSNADLIVKYYLSENGATD